MIVIAAVATLAVTVPAFALRDEPTRTIGRGIVKFNGHGAEQWASIARRHERRAARLERRIARLDGRLRRRLVLFGTHSLERAFLCIHHYEGAWNANTGNGYFGGLQMDSSFQRSYGAEYLRAFGSADKWPVSVQLAVAIRAYYSGRGFNPWPNTARACGLL